MPLRATRSPSSKTPTSFKRRTPPPLVAISSLLSPSCSYTSLACNSLVTLLALCSLCFNSLFPSSDSPSASPASVCSSRRLLCPLLDLVLSLDLTLSSRHPTSVLFYLLLLSPAAAFSRSRSAPRTLPTRFVCFSRLGPAASPCFTLSSIMNALAFGMSVFRYERDLQRKEMEARRGQGARTRR